MSKTYRPDSLPKEEIQAICNKLYPGTALFARDLNLPEELARRYTPGLIIREKAFTDASNRFMGMVTTHRYVILSNHMRDMSRFEHNGWGLHVAQKDARFKVLGQCTHQGKTGIFLLHLPEDESWKLWQTAEFTLDRQLYAMAVERFKAKCTQPPVPELTARAWLDRCTFPLGMSDHGQFWPLEDAPDEAAAPGKEEPPAPRPASDDPREVKRSRYIGCLLGGAVGDALGYPVEFIRENAIREKYGPQGIRTLAQAGQPAFISDDTQMTLFAANAIVYTKQQGGDLRENLWTAYREWLGTQGDTGRMEDPEHPRMWVYKEPRMHARRAPGNSCLNAIYNSPGGGTPEEPVNNSKGCGTVMRAAPFGLAVHHDPGSSHGDDFLVVHKMAVLDAALTHGHMAAWASSSILAQLIHEVVQRRPRRDYRLENVIPPLVVPFDVGLGPLLRRAVELALDASVSDLEGIHALGEGWVADEALAIAVFCAVRYQDDFAAAIRAAVNHKGDSDSTGAICGNLLGAWLGKEAVEAAFDLKDLELREIIEKMADQLFEAVEGPAEKQPPREPAPAPAAKPREEPSRPQPMKPLRPVGLLYTPLAKKALQICCTVHRHQLDKSGLPYIIHPLHLAEQMETEEEICTALLHDVLEDSDCPLQALREAGFPETVLEALQLLTRNPYTHYLDYVVRLRKDPIARRVKLADLLHNSDLHRLDQVTPQDRRRVVKYRMARAILEDDRYDEALDQFRKVLPLSLEEPLYLSVFYDRQGAVRKYSIDIEKAEDFHYELTPHQAEKLRQALDPSRLLPDALADWVLAGNGCYQVDSLLMMHGIAFRCFHF